MALICSLDFETSSSLDLTVVGAYRYAQSAKIMCAGYAIYEENTFKPEMVKAWRAWKGEPMPDELVRALMTVTVRKFAWNAQFERLITLHAAGLAVPQEQWFCTAARARASAYPGKLDLCAKALAIPQKKDLAGGKLMKKLSTEGTGTEEEYERVLEYCMQDVVVEATIGMVIRDMTAEEWEDYHVCERMNDRGIPIDVELARAAQRYAEVEAAEIAKELAAATNGEITSAKQFARIKKWVAVRAPEIEEQFTDEETGKFSLDRSARTAIFESDLQISEEVREVLELIDDAGRASTAKYAAIENRTDTDGRLRGAYLFNGAGQTGRYSAMGLQPHNLVRDKLDNSGDVIEAVLDGASADEVTKLSGQNMLTTLGRMLRPTIVAEEGNVLVWADYSAVEARALPWLSGSVAAEPLLDIFRRNEDVYKHAAMDIYGVPFDKVDKAQRQIGKISTLALGFGGGANAFRKMARAYGLKINDDTAEEIKVAWRLANPWAKTFWRDLEGAAVRAARTPGTIETAGRISYLMHGDMLYALLPCGRLIAYPEVEVVEVDGKYGPQARVSSLKASMHPKKGETAWPRVTLYGGLLAENCTQAFCASLLRAAVRRLDEAGWPVVMHTHDEVLVEVHEGEIDDAKAALQEAMLTNEWPDLPLAAEPEYGYSYDK